MWLPDAMLLQFRMQAKAVGFGHVYAVQDRDPLNHVTLIVVQGDCERCGERIVETVEDAMEQGPLATLNATLARMEEHNAGHALADGSITRAQLLVELSRALRAAIPDRAEAFIKAAEVRLTEKPIGDLAELAIKSVAAAHDEADLWDPDVEDFHARFVESVSRRLREGSTTT